MHGNKRQRRMAPNDTAKKFQVNLIGLIGCLYLPKRKSKFWRYILYIIETLKPLPLL